MPSLRYQPRAPLARFVNCLWYWEGATQTHAKERLLPNGEAAIIFNLQDEAIRVYDARDLSRYSSFGGAVISGARADCFVIDTDQQERVVGIQFRPGGAAPFLRMPASELDGVSVRLEDVWGPSAAVIRERLLAAAGPEAMLRELELCLLEQLVGPLDLHPAVTFALARFEAAAYGGRVSAVTDEIGLSARRFIEVFRKQVGLAPKVFCRVRRFQGVLTTVHQTVQRSRDVDWARVAVDCGYYDQAHFIHDFQSFSGLTPGGYSAAATANLNHVRVI